MHGGVNKELVRQRFARRLKEYRRHAIIQESMACELAELICGDKEPQLFGCILEIGSGSGAFTEALLGRCGAMSYVANDLVGESRELVRRIVSAHHVQEFSFIAADIEECERLPDKVDLAASNATVQWLTDMSSFFMKMSENVRPGGMLAFSTFGRRNMLEVGSLEPHALNYHSLAELEDMARPWFMPLVLHEDVRKLDFRSPEEVLRHISRTGVNGLARERWTKTRHRSFVERYRSSFPSGSGVHLTYHPLFCVFRRK
ncbi:malonyl-ACP O-methyltransferase BioC [Prosthecochloris sp. SCSIO W1102]|uniref:malonyl-ACP O-methyltransferase BioC n=1 Tax=Prosthecochloris sp. SCSIO W1102 TaxID=2992243 RepID=UPI00223D486B|nr:malonyl-ACP O-methyltransferase BioC [Prosthecochloris sp. SCSIO W1102]UZJ40134.1 malonyl-ACP O-methyltransferase BioC [Prosthecochloris sp. SCSIO W1102]